MNFLPSSISKISLLFSLLSRSISILISSGLIIRGSVVLLPSVVPRIKLIVLIDLLTSAIKNIISY
jgi:hypothetical protein